MYLTDLGSNPYIIGDDNYQSVIQETQDGGFSTGMARRDYNRYREGFYAPMTRQEIFPRSKWDDLIKMQDDNESSPWHWEKAAKIPVLDQNGQGYCWCYGVVAGVMNRYAANGYNPVPFLSAHGPAWQGKNGRDEGGWAGEAVKYIEKYGIPTTDTWPEKSMNGRVHAANHEQQLDAARHKIVQFEELQRQNFAQAISCLLDPTNPCPVTLGLMWWGHLVCGVRAVKIDRNEYGIEIKNSWRNTWGNGGFAVLKESKATAHEYVAIRQVKQRAA